MVASIQLQAGVYALFGKSELTNLDSAAQGAGCSIAGDKTDVRLGEPQSPANLSTVSVQSLLTLTGPSTVNLVCHSYNGLVTNAKITALKVGALHG